MVKSSTFDSFYKFPKVSTHAPTLKRYAQYTCVSGGPGLNDSANWIFHDIIIGSSANLQPLSQMIMAELILLTC